MKVDTTRSSARRIALVGYASDYFWSFSRALEDIGFVVYWVTNVRSEASRLARHFHVPAHRVLDTTAGFDPAAPSIEECRDRLAELETADGPRIHDVILMDRLLRRKPQAVSLRYLRHLQTRLGEFFSANDVELITSGRDTALQLMSMLVARKAGRRWVVPTRVRVPRDMYAFCERHETEPMVRIRAVTDTDRAWARAFLEEFTNRSLRPVIQIAARSFVDVLRLLPYHARSFSQALRASFADAGNDYSRYTIPRLVRMYVRRRVNLLRYKLAPPCSSPGNRPFCFYTLHTQPESSIDVAGSFYADQVALVTMIARALPATHELYVKVHPADVDGKPLSFYRTLAHIPGVRLIDFAADSRDLIRRASLIFALTGTSGYEAALLGKTVVAFGRNYFNTLPTVHYCEGAGRLPELVDALLKSPPADSRERVIEFLADLRARAFDGELNRTYGEQPQNLSEQDLKVLQIAYDTLYRVLVPNEARNERALASVGGPQLTP